jgi:hypothetical protein
MPRGKRDILVDGIAYIDPVGIELPPSEEMRNAVWRYAPIFVLDAAGYRPHKLGGRRKSLWLAGTGIGRQHSAIHADEHRSVRFQIEAAEKVFKARYTDLYPDDAVEFVGG